MVYRIIMSEYTLSKSVSTTAVDLQLIFTYLYIYIYIYIYIYANMKTVCSPIYYQNGWNG